MIEHYQLEISPNVIRLCTEKHAKKMFEAESFADQAKAIEGIVIAESDGSMVPIVETGIKEGDRRKNKKLFWKEARLSMAHIHGSKTIYFAGTMMGVEHAGQQLFDCFKRAGGNEKSKVHALGDGAQWIANQVELKFGSRGSYLIDFYHLCEYLSEAATVCAANDPDWMEIQKERMKTGQKEQVLSELRKHLETNVESKASVKACLRYLENRENQFDYASAIKNGLPIGSGEIESAHRYVIQKRIKLAGAWWSMDKISHMIALRVCKANGDFDAYWRRTAA